MARTPKVPPPSKEELLIALFHALNNYLAAASYEPLEAILIDVKGDTLLENLDGRLHVTSHVRSITITNHLFDAANSIAAALTLRP